MAVRAGRVTIPHDPSEVFGNYDVPLYPADVGYQAGMASYAQGIKRIPIEQPVSSEYDSYVGAATSLTGRKRIRSAAPPEATTATTTGSLHLRVGYIRINSKEDKE